MKRTWLCLIMSLLLPSVLAAGCGRSNSGGGSSSKAIIAFGITNPATIGSVNEGAKTISVTVPLETDTTSLVATFRTTGTSVVVGGTTQVSGATLNNFSFPVVYTVNAADGSTQDYTVTVTVAAAFDVTAKAITSYSFQDGGIGVINEKAKAIYVNFPEGTSVVSRIAKFTHTGASITAGGITQVSGTTLHDFTNPIVYTVTAVDGSQAVYTVTAVFFVPGTLITAPTVSPITSFGQTRPGNDNGTRNNANGYFQECFPGQSNVWDIGSDFSLSNGGDHQFNGALSLEFDASFFGDPTGIAYHDLTFFGPLMGTAQKVLVAAVSSGTPMGVGHPAGQYAAFLNATSDSRLMQTLDLTSSVTGTITLSWYDRVNLFEGYFLAPKYKPSYRVFITDNVGEHELYSTTDTTVASEGTHTADLTGYKGKSITLSFEERSVQFVGVTVPNLSLTIIDSVSTLDSASSSTTEYVKNGGFELGILTDDWKTNTPAEVQNMTSGVEIHDGLEVKRSFYTVPENLWGRWVDVFENKTAIAITTTVYYSTELGAAGNAIIYDTPLTGNKAITAWDGAQTTRDIGMVFGSADQVDYTSATALNTPDGLDTIDFSYDITVPPGGRVALVNFIILGTYDTSLTALDISAKATEIDTEAQTIVNNFWSDPQYRAGMTQQQVDAIKNF